MSCKVPEMMLWVQTMNSDEENFDATAKMVVRKGHEMSSLLAGMAAFQHLSQEEAEMYSAWSTWMREWLDRMFPPETGWPKEGAEVIDLATWQRRA